MTGKEIVENPLRRVITVTALAISCFGTFQKTSGELVEGFTEPYRQIDVAAASEAGLITEVNVREGEVVQKDELLAKLDTDVLVATLNVATERANLKGKIAAAQAELQLRRSRLEKLRRLVQEGHATEGEVDRAQTDLAIAEANLILAEEEIKLNTLECRRIETQIQRRHVRSPIDGVVVQVHREAGESVVINDPRLITLVQLDPLRVKFSMSVQQASQLQVGQALPLLLTDIQKNAEGVVEVVAPVLDAKSGTVQVTCVIDNNNDRFRSGMRCVYQAPGATSQPADRAAQSVTQTRSR